jgi:hypothetical protein
MLALPALFATLSPDGNFSAGIVAHRSIRAYLELMPCCAGRLFGSSLVHKYENTAGKREKESEREVPIPQQPSYTAMTCACVLRNRSVGSKENNEQGQLGSARARMNINDVLAPT